MQRVKFDVASGSYRKLNTPLRFDPEVFMDRYFLEQREQTTQVRRVVTQWRSDLNVLDKNIKAITNYKVRTSWRQPPRRKPSSGVHKLMLTALCNDDRVVRMGCPKLSRVRRTT